MSLFTNSTYFGSVCNMSLDSYGGDPQVLATRTEIQRVGNEASAAIRILETQSNSLSGLYSPVKASVFHLEVAGILPAINRFAASCQVAAEAYFSTETRISRELAAGLPRMLQENPWLASLLSPLLSLGTTSFALAVALSGGKLLNSPVSLQLAQQLVAMSPSARSLDTALDRTGLIRETGVSAKLYAQSRPASPPLSLAVLARRLAATGSLGKPYIRIERYLVGGGVSRWVVYVPGTQDWSLRGSRNPLDMASNIKAMSSANLAGSERAVVLAMKQVGIKAGEQVLLVGHSQGGIVAANIASQKQKFKVAGLVTFGSPIARISTPRTKAVIAVQHTNDLVPTLSGMSQPLLANRAVVQKTFQLPSDAKPVAAHNMSNYVKTAGEADISTNSGLAKMRAQITNFVRGKGFGQVTLARIRRKSN